MKENNLQPRLLYPARISFKYEGQIKSFTDQQKLREFSTAKPALPTNAKGYSLDRRHKNGVQTRTQNNKVSGNWIILINNYLNVNGLNASTKRQRLAEGIQDPYICCLQEDPPQT